MGTNNDSRLPEHIRQFGEQNPDTHSIAYGIDRYAYNQGYQAKYDFQVFENIEPCLVARGGVRLLMLSRKSRSFMCDRLQVGTTRTSGTEQADSLPKAMTSIRSDSDHVPVVFVLNQQDKKGTSVTKDMTNALLREPKRQPVICLNDQGGGRV